MKKVIILILVMCFSIGLAAQEKPIKVVFDVTSADPEIHKSAARHLRLMSESYPDSQFEMVIYSGAYSMVDGKSSAAGETLRKIIKMDNVSIIACENTLKRNKKTKEDLIPGVGTVPDGIYEIAMKQHQGWAYIKEIK